MTKLRRSFTDGFKREAIALLASSGRPLLPIAGEPGIQPSMLRRWRSAGGDDRKVPGGVANRALLGDIRRIHEQQRGRYGAPRIDAASPAEGRLAGRGRRERLMRRHGIRAMAPRRFRVVTADNSHGLPIAENLPDQTFAAIRPNQVWRADIPSIPTDGGGLYLETRAESVARIACQSSMALRTTSAPI